MGEKILDCYRNCAYVCLRLRVCEPQGGHEESFATFVPFWVALDFSVWSTNLIATTTSSSSFKTLVMPQAPLFTTSVASTMLPSFPALYLYPLNADSFVKHINLTNNQRVKIGRQTNARTVPAENNGYFDSKVLSRQHAEVWEENNKVSR